MSPSAQAWIKKLKLKPHPEGGWYREIYRSGLEVSTPAGMRSAGTAIYFLLSAQEVSHFHRLAFDEIWHFYAGGPLSLHLLSPASEQRLSLGPEQPVQVVPAGSWFAASLDAPQDYALVGCTMAPGFAFEDFKLAEKSHLLGLYPDSRALIERLCF